MMSGIPDGKFEILFDFIWSLFKLYNSIWEGDAWAPISMG